MRTIPPWWTPASWRRRDVTLGKNDGDYIEVTGGLEEGDMVLIANQSFQYDGHDDGDVSHGAPH